VSTAYLGYSAALHAAFVVLLIAFSSGWGKPKTGPIYSIDFVGPSGGIIDSLAGRQNAKSAASAAAKPAPQTTPDDFTAPRRKRGDPLPKPSLLRGFSEKVPLAAPAGIATAEPSQSSNGSSGGGEAGVATDMANFPYPWYIAQVRASLWAKWSERLPRDSGEAVIVFIIMPKGDAVDVRTAESSGDSAFDLTALSAVQDAAPFPPLPKAFDEPFLKVHVTLKTR
jgi:protein TonB